MTRSTNLRKRLQQAAPGLDDDDAYDPLGAVDGWSKSLGDPEAIVRASEVLRVKPAYKLIAYQYRAGGNGNGIVWALPAEADFLPPELCETLEEWFASPPRPPDAIDHYMDAIDGDGSMWSFFAASILMRELHEYGAMWHGVSWGAHELVCRDPWSERRAGAETLSPRKGWTWHENPPDDWRPSVKVVNDEVKVRFFTFTGLGREQIVQHEDSFSTSSYRPEVEQVLVAEGVGGYIF